MLATLVSRDLPWAMDSIMAQESENVAVYKITCPTGGHKHQRIAAGRDEALWMFQRWPEFCESASYVPAMDALMFVDDDVILPDKAAERLYAIDAPVVYGLTVRRREPYHWGVCYDEDAGGPRHSYSQSARWLQAAKYNEVLPVTGGDASCVLIRRYALQKWFEGFDWTVSHCTDWHFARWCNQQGIRQVVATDVKCGHVIEGGPSATAVWPFGTGHRIRRLT